MATVEPSLTSLNIVYIKVHRCHNLRTLPAGRGAMSGPWWGRGRWRSTPASGLMVLCMMARVSGHSMSHCPVTSHCLVTVLSSLQSQYLLSSLITAVTRCSVRGPGRASTDSGRSGGAGGAARPHYGQDWAGWAGWRPCWARWPPLASLALACTCGHGACSSQSKVTQVGIVQSR